MITTPVAKLFMSNTDNNSLDVLLVGGEKLGQFNNDCDYCLVDGFGPTEAFSFISLINNEEKLHYSSVGKLNYNTKAYVLDDELRRVPIGAAGELYISGCQVADGYLNRPEENKKAFLNNHHSLSLTRNHRDFKGYTRKIRNTPQRKNNRRCTQRSCRIVVKIYNRQIFTRQGYRPYGRGLFPCTYAHSHRTARA